MLLDSIKRRMTRLDHVRLVGAAMHRTGLDDLGDPHCKEALKVLIDSCNAEAGLNLFGQIAAQQHLRDLIETRLRLINYWQKTPEIQKQAVLPPLFITGLPKSGSTFLHRLFARDPSNRVPRTWEVMFPLPSPICDDSDLNRHAAKTERRLRWFRWTQQELVKAHPIGARLPQECGAILSYSFQSRVFLDMFSLPSYETWLGSQDMSPAYAFHLSMLKHLQRLCMGDRWVLKSSDHVHALSTLLQTYPEARLVFLHRDPTRVLQAAASQMILLKRAFRYSINPRRVGAYESRKLVEKIRKITEFRDRFAHMADRFMDIRYLDLARDPLATMRAIYDRFGFAFSPEAESKMNAFAESERKVRRRDKYPLTAFSRDPQQEDSRFDLYCERFGIAREPL